ISMSKLSTAVLARAALFVAAFASPSLQSAWYATSYRGGAFKRVIGVGVGANIANRRVFEDIFAQKLSSSGVQGIPGYQFLPDDAPANEPGWNAGVAQHTDGALLRVRG